MVKEDKKRVRVKNEEPKEGGKKERERVRKGKEGEEREERREGREMTMKEDRV